jgi:hypothetical protein
MRADRLKIQFYHKDARGIAGKRSRARRIERLVYRTGGKAG